MCGSSIAVPPHLHMNKNISSISMDLVGTIGRSTNSQAIQCGSQVIRLLNSRLHCIYTFKQHLHCLIRWCWFGAGMRGDSIPSHVLIASQPQEGDEASRDFRAKGLQGFISLSSVARMRTSYEASEHHTSRLIALLHLNRSLTSLGQCIICNAKVLFV